MSEVEDDYSISKSKRRTSYQKVKADGPGTASWDRNWKYAMRFTGCTGWAIVITILVLTIILTVREDEVQYHSNSSCSDGNQCTVDYQFEGGCQSFKLQNGVSCSNVCYTNGTSDTCNHGLCTGPTCAGSCVTQANCPTISQAASVDCVNQACLYATFVTAPNALPATVIGGPVLNELCLFSVNNTAYVNCLEVTAARNSTLITCTLKFACASMYNVLA